MSTSTLMDPTGQQGQPEGHGGHIRLACQACQRKKIKCDRNFPCGQCLRSSLKCVPSQRKPRARHAGKRAVDSELRSRISKLESLVESLSGEVGLSDDLDDDDGVGAKAEAASERLDQNGAAVARYIASPFWSSLTSEVQALREVLEEDNEFDDDAFSPGTSSSGNTNSQQTQEYDLIICPPGVVYAMPGALNEPSPQLQSELYGIYIEHVAPMTKVFHIPSLRRMLERGEPYLGQEPNSPGNKCVRAALWFAAANALKEEEAQIRFGQTKSELINNYRRYVDVLLSQADLMVTTDLATLQAFATYLVVSRAADSSRRTWTLTSLAVRIAQAMGLTHEPPGQYSVYYAELRRRLWHQIRFIDLRNSSDRGTEPLIMPGTYDIPVPSNVNDADFDESSTTIVPREKELTEMAFGLLVHEANTHTAKLNQPPDVHSKSDPWQVRIDAANEFREVIRNKFQQFCDLNNPFHRVVYKVGQSMQAGMILRAVRPMNFKHVHNFPAPRTDSPQVLKIAVDAVREGESVYEDPDNIRWRWLIWVHWHPLAVALAGLCSIRDTELAENAWPIVERSYIRHAQQVADSRTGMLWRPIEKLYKKATMFRWEGRRESQSTNSQSPTGFAYMQKPATGSPPVWTPPNFNTASMGNIPLDPSLANATIDFNGFPDDSAANIANLSLSGDQVAAMPQNDTSWLDWERIMSDMSTFDQTGLAQMPPSMMNLDSQVDFPMSPPNQGMPM